MFKDIWHRRTKVELFLYLILFLLFFTPTESFSQNSTQVNSCQTSVVIASGREDGRYFDFVLNWSNYEKQNNSGLCIENKATNGSRENLDLLAAEAVSFALIQNDIGHNAFYGKRGYPKNASFSGLKAIYKEYVQIVYRKADGTKLNTISDLTGKAVAAGNPRSGGYWNAMDLLQAANLQNGFHFRTVDNGQHPLEMLNSGLADVAIYTSSGAHKLVLDDSDDSFGFIELPQEAATRLSIAMKRPYYDHGALAFMRDGELVKVSTVAVHAYFVTANSTSSAIVEQVNRSVNMYIDQLVSSDQTSSHLEFLNSELEDLPFDMHYLASDSLGNRFLATILSIWFQLALAALAIMVMIGGLYMRRQRYSSVGLIEYNSFVYLARQRFITFSQYALGFAFWLFWLWIVASVIVDQEHRFASARGFESPLEGIGVFERISWLVRTSFTTLPGEIPLSPTASILIPLTVLLGLGAFIYPVVVYFSAKRERDDKKYNGNWNFNGLEEHVVICGWNERVPGVIYSLISEYTPITKKVIVVAETPDKNPLVSRGFDPARVMFVRGNAADTSILRRAGASNAAEAIVMACDTKSETKNVNSILTAIALRKLSESNERTLKPELFIGAELINPKNKHAFMRAGVDSLVHVEDVADKVCAANLLSFGVADYVTDLLTFDDHFEIYSKQLGNFPDKFKSMTEVEVGDGEPIDDDQKYDFERMRQAMMHGGMQLAGYSKSITGARRDSIVLANKMGNQLICSATDRLIYFSVRKNKVGKTTWRNQEDFPNAPLPVDTLDTKNDHLVIIGGVERTARIASLLKSRVNEIRQINIEDLLEDISGQVGDELREELIQADSILLLDCASNQIASADRNFNLVDCADTAALLVVKFLNDLRIRKNCQFKIVAEVKNHSTREIFTICGADDIIVRNSLIERLLAKMVFNHGKMYDVISHLITLNNGVHISLRKVAEGDYFVGKDIRELMLGKNDTYQICGWLPTRLEDYLKRNTMGTESHYITAFNSKYVEKQINQNAAVSVGDTLVMFIFD